MRFSYHESQFCFVTSHLAAGQHKVDKRNQDYKTVISKIHFPMGEREITILDHEYQ